MSDKNVEGNMIASIPQELLKHNLYSLRIYIRYVFIFVTYLHSLRITFVTYLHSLRIYICYVFTFVTYLHSLRI